MKALIKFLFGEVETDQWHEYSRLDRMDGLK